MWKPLNNSVATNETIQNKGLSLCQDTDCVNQHRKILIICHGGVASLKEYGGGLQTSSRSVAISTTLSNPPTGIEAEVNSLANCGPHG